MARVNVGVNPLYLTDNWLIAESVEITMITGSLRINNYQIKSEIPNLFTLGKGHMNFFKNKLIYLQKRLQEVNKEMLRRGFHPGTSINLDNIVTNLINDWSPTLEATNILRERLYFKLNRKPNIWRYNKKNINHNLIKDMIQNSEVYYV